MALLKFLQILLLVVLLSVPAFASRAEKPVVIGTASMFADIAANIGGDLIETDMIVPVGGDPHIYEPTPGDVRKILKADLILMNGLTFEGWINELVRNSGSDAPVIILTEGIEPIVSTQHQNATDPHAWMDPVNGKTYALNIKEALIRLLPNHAEQITEQYETYIRKLEELDAYIESNIDKIEPHKRILITSHDAFHYYGKRYGVRLESVLGTSTDADVRTSDLIRLNEVIRDNDIPVVFIESTINPKLLQQVATDNKITVGGKLYSDSLGDPDGPAGTYLDMLKYNTDVIVNGLTSQTPSETGIPPARDHSKWFVWLGVVFLASFLLMWLFRRKTKAV